MSKDIWTITDEMETIPIQLFLYLSKLMHLQNPLVVMTEHEEIPAQFCAGESFPVACMQYGASNVADVAGQLLYKSNVTRKFSPVFLSEDDHTNLVRVLSTQPLTFTKTRVWVMPLEHAPNIPLRLDSNIFFYNRTSPTGFIVYESYAIKGGIPITSELFRWPQVKPSMIVPINLLEKRTLNGAIMNVAWQGSAFDIVGINVDILADLQARLNFTIQIIPAKDKKWGSKGENGSWNGLVGMLTEKNIDMTLGLPDSGVMITEERQIAIDYLWSFEHVTMTLLTSKSSKPRLDVWAYVNVFPLAAWLCGLGMTVVCGICFSVSSHESVVQGITLMVRLFLQLGYELPVRRYASKVLLLSAALGLMVMYLYYNSELTAKMTSEPQGLNIKSFSDAEKQGYKVITSPHGYVNYDILAKAPENSIFKRIHENKVHEVVPVGINRHGNAIKRIKEDSKALYFTYQRRSFEKMGIVALDITEAVPIFKAIALQKDSEFITLLNHHIFQMIEIGKINRLKQKWAGKHDNKYGMEEAIELGYEHVLFPYAWLALGVVLTLPMVFGEICFKRWAISKRLAKVRKWERALLFCLQL